MLRHRSIATALIVALIAACAVVPFDQPKNVSVAIVDTADTALGRRVGAWTRAHGGLSGFYPLLSGTDALGARLRLIESAERGIDAQYFLMKPDTAGHIFAGALLQAADRGVRVRLLLDDVFTTAHDEDLAALDRHPNIEVRLYNPISRSGSYYLNFVGDFRVANRRMHNKSLTVDSQVTIVGGRNIADEYFELQPEGDFLDFDVIGVGPVAREVAATFDAFWNHSHSVPLGYLMGDVSAAELDARAADIRADFADAYRSIYAAAIQSRLVSELFDGTTALYPAAAEVVTDAPEKLTSKIDSERRQLVNHLVDLAVEADKEIVVITPYFVPRDAGLAFWRNLTERGVRVVIATNSLASNNHLPVHAAYSKYRRPMLEAGAELYELRADAVGTAARAAGIDQVTLHTKLVIIDRDLVFVGSLNLDPRSIDINAEMGIVIRSQPLATDLAEGFLAALPERTYRLELDGENRVRWNATIDGVTVSETRDPLASNWRRFQAMLLRVLPDSQL